jgi:hypothetical protein
VPIIPERLNPQQPVRTGLYRFLQWRDNNKFTFNLMAIITFLILLPLFEDSEVTQIFINVLLLLVLFFAVLAISHNIIYMGIGTCLGGITVVLEAFFFFTGDSSYLNAAILGTFFFFAFVTVVIFFGIIKERKINRDVIFGAISVYFLLGMTWAFGIYSLEIFVPLSFNIGGHGVVQLADLSDYIGYSFSVLTTTGNYSVSTLTSTARMVMMFEMIIGTLYIAILISWLVGRFLWGGSWKE